VNKRSSNHVKAQRNGRKRDLNTCQICGSTNKTQGHHIFDVFFNGSSSVDNIITLCEKHHKKVHLNLIDIFKI
jgi:5-methylcytosine-specific restriction endonuclease McrA